MQSEVMFAGFGGQGILLSAKILAHAAMEEGFEVAWVPSWTGDAGRHRLLYGSGE